MPLSIWTAQWKFLEELRSRWHNTELECTYKVITYFSRVGKAVWRSWGHDWPFTGCSVESPCHFYMCFRLVECWQPFYSRKKATCCSISSSSSSSSSSRRWSCLRKSPVVANSQYVDKLYLMTLFGSVSKQTTSACVIQWKCQLQTWKTCGKKMKLTIDQKVLELKEDRSLFARMLVISESRKDLCLVWTLSSIKVTFHCWWAMSREKQTYVYYAEFASWERGLRYRTCDSNGTSKSCSRRWNGRSPVIEQTWLDLICAQLADHFEHFPTMKLIWQIWYWVIYEASNKKQKNRPIPYHRFYTNIANVPLKKLLSHNDIKNELTILKWFCSVVKRSESVLSWRGNVNVEQLTKTWAILTVYHEEADKKLIGILHAAEATEKWRFKHHVTFFWHRSVSQTVYEQLFVTGSRKHPRVIPIGLVFEAFHLTKQQHCWEFMRWVAVTTLVAGRAKSTFWEAFQNVDAAITNALAKLEITSAIVPWLICDNLSGLPSRDSKHKSEEGQQLQKWRNWDCAYSKTNKLSLKGYHQPINPLLKPCNHCRSNNPNSIWLWTEMGW